MFIPIGILTITPRIYNLTITGTRLADHQTTIIPDGKNTLHIWHIMAIIYR